MSKFAKLCIYSIMFVFIAAVFASAGLIDYSRFPAMQDSESGNQAGNAVTGQALGRLGGGFMRPASSVNVTLQQNAEQVVAIGGKEYRFELLAGSSSGVFVLIDNDRQYLRRDVPAEYNDIKISVIKITMGRRISMFRAVTSVQSADIEVSLKETAIKSTATEAIVAPIAVDDSHATAPTAPSTASGGLTKNLVFHMTHDTSELNDVSRNQNRISAKGGVNWLNESEGREGVFKYNGVDGAIMVRDSKLLDETSNAFTISAWIYDADKKDGKNDDRVIMSKGDKGYTKSDAFILRVNNYKQLELSLSNGKELEYFSSKEGVVKQDQWVHVAATYDGKNVVLYLNGFQIFSSAAKGELLLNAGDLAIGRQSEADCAAGYLSCWNGMIDDVKVYNYAMSQKEVASLAVDDLTTTELSKATVCKIDNETCVDGAVVIMFAGDSKKIRLGKVSYTLRVKGINAESRMANVSIQVSNGNNIKETEITKGAGLFNSTDWNVDVGDFVSRQISRGWSHSAVPAVEIRFNRRAESLIDLQLGEPEINGCEIKINGYVSDNLKPVWDWGDGTAKESQYFPVIHIYPASGKYAVTVMAANTRLQKTVVKTEAVSVTDCSNESASLCRDYGQDPFIKEKVYDPDMRGFRSDVCWDAGKGVTEYYCGINPNTGKLDVHGNSTKCANGCNDGACIRGVSAAVDCEKDIGAGFKCDNLDMDYNHPEEFAAKYCGQGTYAYAVKLKSGDFCSDSRTKSGNMCYKCTTTAVTPVPTTINCVTKTLNAGDIITLDVGGKKSTVGIVGVKIDASTVMITINGESKQMYAGETQTLGGVKVTILKILSYTDPTARQGTVDLRIC